MYEQFIFLTIINKINVNIVYVLITKRLGELTTLALDNCKKQLVSIWLKNVIQKIPLFQKKCFFKSCIINSLSK